MSPLQHPLAAYFCQEIGVRKKIPNFSGGLGILNGDQKKSAADLGLPMVGVTLLYRHGYLIQRLDHGAQLDFYPDYDPSQDMTRVALKEPVHVELEGSPVLVTPWQMDIRGNSGHVVHELFLDTRGNGNIPGHEDISGWLYGADKHYRLLQEAVLGIGGVRVLEQRGKLPDKFHMNEGHAALLVIELLHMGMPLDEVRNRCVFTTHTPVPAGHDCFDWDMVQYVLRLSPELLEQAKQLGGRDHLNMTWLAMNGSGYVNAVSQQHAVVTQDMFKDTPLKDIAVRSITNGVHPFTWTSNAVKRLYDRHAPGWREDPSVVGEADIPLDEQLAAHSHDKARLIQYIERENGIRFDPELPIIGFARRFATYKRPLLMFHDIDRLLEIGAGKLQVVFAGKAHPQDSYGKMLIRQLNELAETRLSDRINFAFLQDYSMDVARIMIPGSDVWLNTPVAAAEASGTSGMKAQWNLVPTLSTPGGWVPEADQRGIFPFGLHTFDNTMSHERDRIEAHSLYDVLAKQVLKEYADQDHWAKRRMAGCRANASHFSTHRVMKQYWHEAYGLLLPENGYAVAAQDDSHLGLEDLLAPEPA